MVPFKFSYAGSQDFRTHSQKLVMVLTKVKVLVWQPGFSSQCLKQNPLAAGSQSCFINHVSCAHMVELADTLL